MFEGGLNRRSIECGEKGNEQKSTNMDGSMKYHITIAYIYHTGSLLDMPSSL
jgi:hypothetical protein